MLSLQKVDHVWVDLDLIILPCGRVDSVGGGAVLQQAHRLSLLFLYYLLYFLALLECGLRGWVSAAYVRLPLLVHGDLQNVL